MEPLSLETVQGDSPHASDLSAFCPSCFHGRVKNYGSLPIIFCMF
jgi:hypothetical protein